MEEGVEEREYKGSPPCYYSPLLSSLLPFIPLDITNKRITEKENARVEAEGEVKGSRERNKTGWKGKERMERGKGRRKGGRGARGE